MRSIVQKSLDKVTELGGSSVAFPLIGTGNLAFPAHEASRIMLDETVTFCQNNAQSSVKDVRFILFRGDQRVIDAFKQESAALQAKYRKTVEVVQGDLTQETTDAIVNIIRTEMDMYRAGELGKAVARASGSQVEEECAKLGQQPAGTAVMTTGGNLSVPNIIHMVVGSVNKQHLQQCVEKCLQLAESKGLKTISLPAAGTGAGGLGEEDSAQVTFQALKNVLGSCVNLRHVRVVLYQTKLMGAFLKEHKLMQREEGKQLVTVSSSPPVKTEEPPTKKPRIEQDAGPDPNNKDKIKINVSGPSKAAVKRATDTLKKGLADAFTTQKVQHKDVSQLSKTQINTLKKCAQTLDVKLEINKSTNVILVHGEHSSVTEMVSKVWCRVNERSELSRANERAKLSGMSLK